MIHSFPKIFSLGTDYIKNIFDTEVEITEKVDGSLFSFGRIDGQLYFRSKGAQIFPENVDKMFKKGVEYALSLESTLPDNTIFYCEYLKSEKHNNLKYNKVPKNNLALFALWHEGKFITDYDFLELSAKAAGIDVVPLLFKGKIESVDKIKELLDTESFLGGCKIEGVVVKNYNMPFLLGGQPIPIMMGKYVSEQYKEVAKGWHERNSSKGKWEMYKECFKTEARWLKAIQHLKEAGKLENSPRDIGNLIKAIQEDIEQEEKENIKEFLWKEFGQEVLRMSVKGFPEKYKQYLLTNSFNETNL